MNPGGTWFAGPERTVALGGICLISEGSRRALPCPAGARDGTSGLFVSVPGKHSGQFSQGSSLTHCEVRAGTVLYPVCTPQLRGPTAAFHGSAGDPPPPPAQMSGLVVVIIPKTKMTLCVSCVLIKSKY